MTDDIVYRLRNKRPTYVLVWQAADEIERLRAERDEARREVCELDAEMYSIYRGKPRPVVNIASCMPWDIAIERGWDCFKKEDEQ